MSKRKERQLKNTLYEFYSNPIAQISLELFLSIFLIVIFAIFAIRPTLLTIGRIIDEIKYKKKFSKRMDDKIQTLISAQELYQMVAPDIEYLYEALPQNPELMKSMKTLERAASDSDVIINNFSVGQLPKDAQNPNKEDKNKYSKKQKTLALKLNMNGDFPSLKDFIARLEEMRKGIEIYRVSYGGGDRDDDQKGLNTVISLGLVYYE